MNSLPDPVIVYHTSSKIVTILSICLLALIGLLVYCYFYLNHKTNDEYTIHQLVYKQGGLRDRVRNATLALEGHLGVRLWPRRQSDEEGEEMQEMQCEEGQVDENSSLMSRSDRDEMEAENSTCGGVQDEDVSDKSSLDGSDIGAEAAEEAEEEVKMQEEVRQEEVGKEEEVEERKEEEEEESLETITVLDQDVGGAGVLINLNDLSGSAIWSDGNVTVL